MNKKKKIALYTCLIFMAGLLLRLLYLYQFSKLPLFDTPAGPDIKEYDDWARAILSDGMLWRKPHIHAPLYPMFLALLYKIFMLKYYWIRLFQAIVGLAAFVPLFFVLRAKFKATKYSLLPWLYLIMAAIYPPLIFYQSELISEVLLLPLLCLIIFTLYRGDSRFEASGKLDWKLLAWYAGAGLLSGLAAITHPLTLLFCAVEFCLLGYCYILRGRKTDKQTKFKFMAPVMFALFVSIPVLTVCIYNSTLEKGSFSIQKNSGFNYFLGNNPEATGGCYLRPGKSWESTHMNATKAAAEKNISKDRYFFGQAMQFLKEHPLDWLWLQAKKCVYVWNCRETTAGADLTPMRYYTSFQRWTWWAPGIIMSLALFGLLANLARREFWRNNSHFLILLFSFWLALTLTVVSGRYRATMLPAVFLLSGFGVIEIINTCRQIKNYKKLLLTAGILAIALLAVYLPSPPVDNAAEQAETETIIGAAYLSKNMQRHAEICFVRAIKASDQASQAYSMLGGLYLKKRKFKESRAMLIKSLEIDPYSCDAYVNLGILSMAMYDFITAEKYFNEAMKKWPNNPKVMYNFGFFLIKSRRLNEAEKVLLNALPYAPSDVNILNALGILYLMDKKPGKAVEYFRRLLDISPRNPGFLLNAAAACIQADKNDEAKTYVSRLLAIQPDSPGGLRLKQILEIKQK